MTEWSRLLDRVRERDIDLLLLAALNISEPFRAFGSQQ